MYADERPEMRELQLIKWNKGGQEKQLKIIADTAPSWQVLGTTFGLSPADLQGFQHQSMMNQQECYRSVLQKWLQNGSQPRVAYPVTWRGLIKAFRDSSLSEIADQLETALCQSEPSLYMIRLIHTPCMGKRKVNRIIIDLIFRIFYVLLFNKSQG